MRRARRKRGECPGAWKCAATAREKQIKTSNAAIGCTIRIEDRLVRVVEGNEKSSALSPVKRPSTGNDQYTRGNIPIDSVCHTPMLTCGIPDLRALASVAIAPAKDAEVIALITAQGDLLDDGC
jgi:hypothetical protein